MSSDDDPERPKYWFPAKRYGWGWGLPIRWQGWVVFGVYFALIFEVMHVYPVRTMPSQFVSSLFVLSLGLVAVCWFKGEPPR